MLQVQSKQFGSYRPLYRRIQSIMFFFSPTSVVAFKADNIYVVFGTRTNDGEGEAAHTRTSL